MDVVDAKDAFVDEFCANQTHRHADAGVGAGADLIEIFDGWMDIVGTEDGGLAEGVGEAEGGSGLGVVALCKVVDGEDFLIDEARSQIWDR